jgi:hypothetical protein
MQHVCLGEAWWAAKKEELYAKAEAKRQAQELKATQKQKEIDRRQKKKGKRGDKKGTLSAISMDVRVRERMGKWRYMLMPWRRQAVVEELEMMDRIAAELDD